MSFKTTKGTPCLENPKTKGKRRSRRRRRRGRRGEGGEKKQELSGFTGKLEAHWKLYNATTSILFYKVVNQSKRLNVGQ